MKSWSSDLMIGIVLAVVMGALLLAVEPFGMFLIWLAGLAVGYGLRNGHQHTGKPWNLIRLFPRSGTLKRSGDTE